MFEIGDVVREKGLGRIFEIINIFDDILILKELKVDKFNILQSNENQVELYVEGKIKGIKSNKIRRTNDVGATLIEFNKEDNMLNLKISENPIHIYVLLKILLSQEEILNHTYERVSPYKIKREFVKDEGHMWRIEFLDIRSKEIVKNVILKTNKDMKLHGEYKLFLPDLLEIAIERGYITRYKDGYKLIKSIDNSVCYCEYVQPEPTVKYLKSQGFIIPDKYKETV